MKRWVGMPLWPLSLKHSWVWAKSFNTFLLRAIQSNCYQLWFLFHFFFYLNGCHSKCLIIHSLLYWWALCLLSLFGNNSVAFGCLAVRSFFNIFKGLVDLVGASLSVCVCVCLLFALLKAWITLFESQVPIDSVWVVLPWVNFLCVKEMSSIHWPALWSLDYWANICVDVCAACLEGSCVFVSVFAFQSCVYVCRCLF